MIKRKLFYLALMIGCAEAKTPNASEICRENYKDPDGDIGFYIGECNDSVPFGQGVIEYSDGDTYAGAYKSGYRHGYGVYTWPSGDRYVGYWNYDNKHGKGTYYFEDGTIMSGEFKDDKLWQGWIYMRDKPACRVDEGSSKCVNIH
ncbi:hypothetical protein [Zooshikella harenae]|uniref:MORN repeat protein n=1 Tax=Zooshikella harenae TaxID=2827238 RepID=A0ABS5ZG43_9GAMM|nr:hypothetical protein [Zooshikella harenae]MBU2713019.1 hypothetical protein [Zooshikella harenae]